MGQVFAIFAGLLLLLQQKNLTFFAQTLKKNYPKPRKNCAARNMALG